MEESGRMCHIGRLLGQISYESLHGHGLRHCMGHPYNLCLPLRPRKSGVGWSDIGWPVHSNPVVGSFSRHRSNLSISSSSDHVTRLRNELVIWWASVVRWLSRPPSCEDWSKERNGGRENLENRPEFLFLVWLTGDQGYQLGQSKEMQNFGLGHPYLLKVDEMIWSLLEDTMMKVFS